MGEIIKAADLVPQEIFFDPAHPDFGLRRADGVRQIHVSTTFTVVDFTNVISGLPGQVSCIDGIEVCRVQPVDPEFLAECIAKMVPGDHLTLFRVADGIWA